MKNHDLVLGTAGHIDHGKSSLILALTGTDPDRLSEEKQRGITIELGFARLSLNDGTTLGVVDVPGHEKFVRQMISGSTGIDMALLCIAADDGVMPQTTEHLAVLELLRIPTLVVALTKTDLVDDEWVEFMIDEVKGRLASGPYENAEVVPVSSRTGEGLDDLKAALGRAAKATKRQKASDSARLPIDRVFTIKGAGTVITGTLWSGVISIGDELEVLPSGRMSRVRSIQIHGESVDRAEAGHRVALNLNALSTEEVRPGDFIAAPHTVTATDRFDADFTYLGLSSSDKPLESGARVHVSHGTREVTGRILRIGDEQGFKPGERAYAQIRLDEELPVSWQDLFIVRSYSPVHVIGGGVVLRAHPKRSTTATPEKIALLDALRDGDGDRAAECAFNLENAPVTCEGIVHAAGCSQAAAKRALESLEKSRKAVCLKSDQAGSSVYFTTPRFVQKMRSAIENALLAFHNENPTSTGMSKEALRQKAAARLSPDCFDALLADAQAA
ncbi:MAG: selenocysteine-specific translation elongation factor, partial [Ellagibacter isourolithinifaciens]|uniref:selenocysteine-specific translation elongation factor n=1 Tax=Ellagibacter isourolithinifaciens TaxID=2137581 RepID=UPI002A918577